MAIDDDDLGLGAGQRASCERTFPIVTREPNTRFGSRSATVVLEQTAKSL